MNLTDPAPLSLPTLLINLILGLVLSLLLSRYYVTYGKSLSNRSRFSQNIPMLTMITLLVISIVKSSLALSLGLVGALSIVRFRTAIKDPEELIYLFFAIAIGLGMGADQRVPTLAAYVLMMGYLLVKQMFQGKLRFKDNNSLYLNLVLSAAEGSISEVFDQVKAAMVDHFEEIQFRRMDVEGSEFQFVFFIKTNTPESLMSFSNILENTFEEPRISIVEQNNLIGG